jgi:hypothetical protein
MRRAAAVFFLACVNAHDPFGQKEGDVVPLVDEVGPPDRAPDQKRVQSVNAMSEMLGVRSAKPEDDIQYPVLISSFLDYSDSAVFLFSHLFGNHSRGFYMGDQEAADNWNPESQSAPILKGELGFDWQVDGSQELIPCTFFTEEDNAIGCNGRTHVCPQHSIVNCPLPPSATSQAGEPGQQALTGTLRRRDTYEGAPGANVGAAVFARWERMKVQQTPLPAGDSSRGGKLGVVGCISVNTDHDRIGEIFSHLAYHRLQGFEHVMIYENSPLMMDDEEGWATWHAFMSKIQPWVKGGHVTVVPWILNKYLDMGFWEAALSLDCLNRMNGKAEWVSNPHTDEYIVPQVLVVRVRVTRDRSRKRSSEYCWKYGTVHPTTPPGQFFPRCCRAKRRREALARSDRGGMPVHRRSSGWSTSCAGRPKPWTSLSSTRRYSMRAAHDDACTGFAFASFSTVCVPSE